MQALLGGKSCFSHTNASNFRRQLQWPLLRYTAAICFYSSCYFLKANCFYVYWKLITSQKPISMSQGTPTFGRPVNQPAKKEERKYWQMSFNPAYRVNAFFTSSTSGICKCTNIWIPSLKLQNILPIEKKTDLINHEGYFPKRYKANCLICKLN